MGQYVVNELRRLLPGADIPDFPLVPIEVLQFCIESKNEQFYDKLDQTMMSPEMADTARTILGTFDAVADVLGAFIMAELNSTLVQGGYPDHVKTLRELDGLLRVVAPVIESLRKSIWVFTPPPPV